MYWLDSAGRVVVSASGIPVDCAVCPCDGGITSPCCPGVSLPSSVCFAFTFVLSGRATLTYDAANGWWQGSGTYFAALCSPTTQPFTARVYCDGGIWKAKLDLTGVGIGSAAACPGVGEDITVTLVSCNPLSLTLGGHCNSCFGSASAFNATVVAGPC